MLRSIGAALAAIAFWSVATLAQAEDLGPAVGSTIPHDLTLTDHAGATKPLAERAGTRGVAVFFSRSLDWCPFCRAQAIDVSSRADDIRASGFEPVVVTYDPVETLATFHAKEALDVTLLSDVGSETVDAFGIRNTEMDGKGRYAGVPHPIVFLVDRNGVIQAKLYEEGYRNRPEIDAIVAAAEAGAQG